MIITLHTVNTFLKLDLLKSSLKRLLSVYIFGALRYKLVKKCKLVNYLILTAKVPKMTASQPRRKLFDFPVTPTSLLSFVSYSFCTLSLLGALLLLISSSPVYSSGDLFLEPDPLKESITVNSRVPRSLVQLDFGDEKYNGHNNPTVLEGGNGGGGGGGDAYETLRQMSLASTQPFIKRRLFNTSVALTVPMFSFTLPQRAAEGSTVDLANQAIFGLFALLTTMLVFAVPVLFTGIRPFDVYGRSMKDNDQSQNILNNLLNSEHTINLMGTDTQNKIGINPEECLQKTICDAHRHPKKFGLFGLPFQIFFPLVNELI